MSAPKGNKFAAHDKPWTNALERVLKQLEVDVRGKKRAGEALRLIAETTVRQAIAGDKDARREIADRLDGKPVQAIANEDGTPFVVQVLRFSEDGKAP